MTNLDLTFTALADPTRRGVVDLLRKTPMRAGDLADALAASKPAMSRHLRVLRSSGLVESGNDGDARERIYRLRQEPFTQLQRWLEHVEGFWTAQLAAFKAHVDGRGLPPSGSGAEGRRGSIDGRGLPPAGSGAKGRRGSIDGRGLPPAGSGAEGRRGSIDGRGLPPAGSGAEGRRGSIDGRGLPPAGSGAEGRRGSIERKR